MKRWFFIVDDKDQKGLVTVFELGLTECINPDCKERPEFIILEQDTGDIYLYCREDFLNVESAIAFQIDIFN